MLPVLRIVAVWRNGDVGLTGSVHETGRVARVKIPRCLWYASLTQAGRVNTPLYRPHVPTACDAVLPSFT